MKIQRRQIISLTFNCIDLFLLIFLCTSHNKSVGQNQGRKPTENVRETQTQHGPRTSVGPEKQFSKLLFYSKVINYFCKGKRAQHCSGRIRLWTSQGTRSRLCEVHILIQHVIGHAEVQRAVGPECGDHEVLENNHTNSGEANIHSQVQ